jgi:hypothetical protein
MRSTVIGIFFVLVATFGVAAYRSTQASTPPIEPGMMPYTPTRIEWLALDLESSSRQVLVNEDDQSIDYFAKQPDTIVIHVGYVKQSKTMDSAVIIAQSLVKRAAETRKWPWVKTEVLLDQVNIGR